MEALKQNKVSWGIIGAGDVCEVKSGPAFQQTPYSQLTAVMRRNAEKARDFANRHGVPKWYSDADALIADPEINAIYIATPPDTHKMYTLKAAAAGKPVYVEKPMARAYSECVAMIKACEKAKVPLYVAYYRRALPNILKVKEFLESDVLGAIRFVTITLLKPLAPQNRSEGGDGDNWRIRPEIAGGGYFYDLASHQLDALDFLIGPVIKAEGFAMNQSGLYLAEDITTGTFLFENGVLGSGTWAFNTAKRAAKEVTTIVGSKGQVSFPFFDDHHVKLEIDGKPGELFQFPMPQHIQQPLIRTVVEDILGKGHCPSTGKSGARTNRVMEQLCRRMDV